MSKRNELVSIVTAKNHKDIQNVFTKIRCNTITIQKEKLVDPFKQYSIVEKILKKYKVKLFVTFTKDHLIIGRSFDNEIIDMLKFNIVNCKKSFEGVVSAEMNMKFAILIINIKDKRIENLFIDIFNMKSSKVCLQNIKYAWVIAEVEDEYILKYCRICENNELQDIGPFFTLKLEDKYSCSDETYKNAIGKKEKAEKNILKNKFNDEIGTLHIDKQDLREIKTKKYYK